MSELVIIASDLYFGTSMTARAMTLKPELPGLKRLARLATRERLAADWRAWLAASLPRAGLARIGPATVAACSHVALESSAAASVWLAEPLHLSASLRTVHLSQQGRLHPDHSSQQRLSAGFATAFAASGYELAPLLAGRFALLTAHPGRDVISTDPARVLGTSIEDSLPRGEGARALRGLGSEIEMWLHEHPLNIERARAGMPAISTLWLWGCGPAPRTLGSSGADTPQIRPPPTTLIGDDPYVAGLAKLNGVAWQPLPSGFPQLTASRTVIVAEVFARAVLPQGSPLDALEAFDRDWVTPALAAVTRAEVGRLTLIANDRSLTFASRHRLRLWRPPRDALEALA